MAASQGEVDTPVGTLKCTLRASKEVTAYFGNFINANQRIANLDSDAITVLVAAGLEKKVKEVEDIVFAAGVVTLKAPVERWLNLLANGGKPYHKLSVQDETTVRDAADEFVSSLPGYKDTPFAQAVIDSITDLSATFIATFSEPTQDEPGNA